jgi:RimJ/RimL family protein N-acetyltransferase
VLDALRAWRVDDRGDCHWRDRGTGRHQWRAALPEKELGWLLYDGYEGRGYVTEAAAAMRDWAFAELGIESLVSYMHPENARSAAVAERLGALRDDAAPRQDPEDIVYRHRRR